MSPLVRCGESDGHLRVDEEADPIMVRPEEIIATLAYSSQGDGTFRPA